MAPWPIFARAVQVYQLQEGPLHWATVFAQWSTGQRLLVTEVGLNGVPARVGPKAQQVCSFNLSSRRGSVEFSS